MMIILGYFLAGRKATRVDLLIERVRLPFSLLRSVTRCRPGLTPRETKEIRYFCWHYTKPKGTVFHKGCRTGHSFQYGASDRSIYSLLYRTEKPSIFPHPRTSPR